jgi:hypothetical protein
MMKKLIQVVAQAPINQYTPAIRMRHDKWFGERNLACKTKVQHRPRIGLRTKLKQYLSVGRATFGCGWVNEREASQSQDYAELLAMEARVRLRVDKLQSAVGSKKVAPPCLTRLN